MATSLASAAGATFDSAGSASASDARDELVGDPVGQRLRRRRRRRRAPPRSSRRARCGTRAGARSRRSRPRSRSKRSARAAGSSGSAARARSSISCGDRDRRQVGLGEVAVVVRLLLGAQRRDRLGPRVEVQRLLLDRAAGAQDRLLARDLGADAALDEAERVHVLELGLGAQLASCRPAGWRCWRRSAASPPPCSRR